MYVVVHHRITEPHTIGSLQSTAGQPGSRGVRALRYYPSPDGSAVTCLWEGSSMAAVREHIEAIFGDLGDRAYLEVHNRLQGPRDLSEEEDRHEQS